MALYPDYAVRYLRKQRGRRWAALVDRLDTLPISDPEVVAFSYTMRRLRKDCGIHHENCLQSLCAECAVNIIDHYPGSENELIDLYENNLAAIQARLTNLAVRARPQPAHHVLAEPIPLSKSANYVA